MRKLNLRSMSGGEVNIVRIASLFPDCVTESKDSNGRTRRLVDFDMLKEALSDEFFEGGGRAI